MPLLPLDDPLAVVAGEPPDPAGAGGLRGQSWATARVVVCAARLAAQGVRGVRLALGRLEDPSIPVPAPYPAAGSGAGPGVGEPGVAVAMTVVADYGQDLHALAERIRARVIEGVGVYLGACPVSVSVHIDDVFPTRP